MNQEYQQEKQEYIRKLEDIVSDANANLALNASGVVTEDVHTRLKALRDRTLVLLPKLRKGEFEIAVVGLEKAGKSTFANALLDMAMLPSAQKRCTYISTCVWAGEKDEATVTSLSGAEFDRNLHAKLELLGIPNAL